MKRVEVKKLGLKSLFKATIYFMLIPILIIALIGIITLIVGISTDTPEFTMVGGMYIGLIFVFPIFYGLISIIMGGIYNLLSRRFGGLVYYVEEDIKE